MKINKIIQKNTDFILLQLIKIEKHENSPTFCSKKKYIEKKKKNKYTEIHVRKYLVTVDTPTVCNRDP